MKLFHAHETAMSLRLFQPRNASDERSHHSTARPSGISQGMAPLLTFGWGIFNAARGGPLDHAGSLPQGLGQPHWLAEADLVRHFYW